MSATATRRGERLLNHYFVPLEPEPIELEEGDNAGWISGLDHDPSTYWLQRNDWKLIDPAKVQIKKVPVAPVFDRLLFGASAAFECYKRARLDCRLLDELYAQPIQSRLKLHELARHRFLSEYRDTFLLFVAHESAKASALALNDLIAKLSAAASERHIASFEGKVVRFRDRDAVVNLIDSDGRESTAVVDREQLISAGIGINDHFRWDVVRRGPQSVATFCRIPRRQLSDDEIAAIWREADDMDDGGETEETE